MPFLRSSPSAERPDTAAYTSSKIEAVVAVENSGKSGTMISSRMHDCSSRSTAFAMRGAPYAVPSSTTYSGPSRSCNPRTMARECTSRGEPSGVHIALYCPAERLGRVRRTTPWSIGFHIRGCRSITLGSERKARRYLLTDAVVGASGVPTCPTSTPIFLCSSMEESYSAGRDSSVHAIRYAEIHLTGVRT